MSHPYLESLNALISGIVTSTPVSEDQAAGNKSVSPNTSSTLSQSEEAVQKAALESAYPLLAMPLIMPASFQQLFAGDAGGLERVAGVSIPSVEMALEESKNKIIMGMLDNWLDSIKEDALRREEELNSLAYKNWLAAQSPSLKQEQNGDFSEKTKVSIMTSAEYQAWIASLTAPSGAAVNAISAPSEALRVGIVNGLDNYLQSVRGNSNPEVTMTLPFMAASFVLGATSLNKEYAVLGPGAQAEFASQQGIYNLSKLLPNDARSDLGLIGALFSLGLVYQATVENIMSPGKAEKRKGMNFARNYVRNVMKMITSEKSVQFIKNLLGDKMGEERKDGILAAMKFVLLATALGIVYKIETGGMTGKEFAAMLSGNMKMDAGDLKTDLVGYLKIQLSMIPKEQQEPLLRSLIGFMDDNHNLDFMLNPSHVFEKVLSDFNSGGPVHHPI